jgi:peptidoglycan/LPS O-acetylase OafA/YrhL
LSTNHSRRDKQIDGWRGIAVLAVLFDHLVRFRLGPFLPSCKWSDLASTEFPEIFRWFAFALHRLAEVSGATGVQIFFAISGYIITSLLLSEETSRGRISIGAFYVRRAFRILPPLFCYVIVCLLLRHSGSIAFPNAAVVSALTFTVNWESSQVGWFFSHIWSLSVEEQFYLIWPILFLLLPPSRRSQFLVALVGWLSMMTLIGLSPRNTVSFGCIALGALFASSPGYRLAIKRLAHGWLIVVTLSFILFSINLRSLPWLYSSIQSVIPFGITYILFASREVPLLRVPLTNPILQVIGLGSYSLYLWQQIFLAWPTDSGIPLSMLWLLPAIAFLSFTLIETPFMTLGRCLSETIKRKPILSTK